MGDSLCTYCKELFGAGDDYEVSEICERLRVYNVVTDNYCDGCLVYLDERIKDEVNKYIR